MSTFNENKLWVNNRLNRLYQLHPRRYTLTHSDQTGELFLVIGSEFAYEQLTTKRDEVVGEWLAHQSGHPYFYIYIRLDGIDGTASTEKRNEIFLQAPIYVFFQSQDSHLNRTDYFGCFNDY